MNDLIEAIVNLLGAIVCLLLSYVLMPVAVTLSMWIEGWVASLIVGNFICDAAAIFGLTLTTAQIPYIFIALGWAGYAFSAGPDVAETVVTKIWTGMFGPHIFDDTNEE